MKHVIYPETQSTISVTAGTSNPNYPATNLTDNDYPKKVWKAVGTSATLSVPVTASSNVVAVFNTNASSVTINGTAYTGLSGRTNLWHEFTASTSNITIAFSGASNIEAGIVRSGSLLTFVNPEYGINEGMNDFSVIKELRNGAKFVHQLDTVRTFSGSVMLTRSTQLPNLVALYKAYGPRPMAMLIAGDIDDKTWCVFGSFDSPPGISHTYPEHSSVSYSITEAV